LNGRGTNSYVLLCSRACISMIMAGLLLFRRSSASLTILGIVIEDIVEIKENRKETTYASREKCK